MKNMLNKVEMVYKNNLLILNLFKTFKFEISNNPFLTKFFLLLLLFAYIFSFIFLIYFWNQI